MSGAKFVRIDTVDWVDEAAAGKAPAQLAAEAAAVGARRKWLTGGEAGFHVQYSELPGGFHIPAHSHSHDELLYVLAGSVEVEGTGEVYGPNDCAAVPAGHEYGLVAGADGLTFLTIRTGEATASYGTGGSR